jgi:hypothetical protein
LVSVNDIVRFIIVKVIQAFEKLGYQVFIATEGYHEVILKEALPNAQLIAETASRQLIAGSIHYLEWVQLINQTIQIKSDYLEAEKKLNESIIQLQFLIAQ